MIWCGRGVALYWSDAHRTLYNHSCHSMPELADDSIQCCVTSPPYWGLRKYKGEQDLIWGGSKECSHEWGNEMLDKDSYPDPESLKQIASWDVLTQPIDGLLELIVENTNWADRQIERRGKRVIYLTYHTGGWSGNEDVIEALKNNYLFWSLFWQRHDTGGHFYFRIDKRRFQ